MIYYIDIDGTICEDIPIKGKTEAEYRQQKPYPQRIEVINRLYELGNEIHYWTARGATRGIDWTDLTREQLEEWGCKYHQLHMGKIMQMQQQLANQMMGHVIQMQQHNQQLKQKHLGSLTGAQSKSTQQKLHTWKSVIAQS